MSASSKSEAVDYHGECQCWESVCTRTAYYAKGGKPFCGYHCAKTERKALPKNPMKAQNRALAYEQHKATISAGVKANADAKERGTTICSKMTMFQGQQPTFVQGFMNVYPNFKHANLYGGWGAPELSPKSMGPVEHGQPGLPPAKNLENFHQFSKLFPGETTQGFRASQKKAFADPEPHRHKPEALLKKKSGQNKNVPLCWIWTRQDGTEIRMSYIECRQFYCTYYERFALASDGYPKLMKALDEGMNLRICGYDGYEPGSDMMAHYMDESRPFGHELVLFTMLTEPQDKWPWRLKKTEDF